MRTLHLRLIGALWSVCGAYWVCGFAQRIWRDVVSGDCLVDELLLQCFFLVFAALAAWAGFGVCRCQCWGVWVLRGLALLVALDMLCYMMMEDHPADAVPVLAFAISTLVGLIFVRANEQSA